MQRSTRTIRCALMLGLPGTVAREQDTASLVTIGDAVALALKGSLRLQSTALDVDRAMEDRAAVKTTRLPQFQAYALGDFATRRMAASSIAHPIRSRHMSDEYDVVGQADEALVDNEHRIALSRDLLFLDLNRLNLSAIDVFENHRTMSGQLGLSRVAHA